MRTDNQLPAIIQLSRIGTKEIGNLGRIAYQDSTSRVSCQATSDSRVILRLRNSGSADNIAYHCSTGGVSQKRKHDLRPRTGRVRSENRGVQIV